MIFYYDGGLNQNVDSIISKTNQQKNSKTLYLILLTINLTMTWYFN